MATNPFGRRGPAGAAPYLGVAPGVGLFVIFFLAPAVAIGYFALTDATGVSGIPIHFLGLANFREFFAGPDSADDIATIERSLIYAAAVTVIQNALGLGIAVVLNGRIRGRTLIRAIIFAPTVLGVTVTALIWQLFLDPTNGPAAALLRAFGAQSAFLGSNTIAFPLVIAVQIWMGLGYSMVIFLAGLQSIPQAVLEAATVDGAGPLRRFRHVTWPLLAPSVTANVLLAIIGSLQSYQLVYVLTDGLHNTSVLGYEVFSVGFMGASGSQLSEQGYAAAISLVQFVITAALALVVLGFLRRREVQL
jgi:raffinose/stachyose/melibiose transport system permease protein